MLRRLFGLLGRASAPVAQPPQIDLAAPPAFPVAAFVAPVAPAPADPPPPPPEPADPPVFDARKFAETSAFLETTSVSFYLSTIVTLAETLRLGLRKEGAVLTDGEALAEAAHALAGSAGMFGFRRVASLAASFERAIRSSMMADAATLAVRLGHAIDATLLAIASPPLNQNNAGE